MYLVGNIGSPLQRESPFSPPPPPSLSLSNKSHFINIVSLNANINNVNILYSVSHNKITSYMCNTYGEFHVRLNFILKQTILL